MTAWPRVSSHELIRRISHSGMAQKRQNAQRVAMKTVNLGEVSLQVHDEGSGPPVLFVHGFPLNHSMWRHQLQHLAPDFRVIAPDLRGFGGSDVSNGTVSMDRFADDLDVLLSCLGIEEPVVLCGLSMGGYIAWQFARRHPGRLRALILCDTRAGADPPDAVENRKRVAAMVLEHGAEQIASAMPSNLLSPVTLEHQPEILDELRQTIGSTASQGIAAASLGMAERPDSTGLLPTLDLPALLIVGEDDRISTVAEMREMAEAMPQGKLVEIPAAGHMAPLENPAPVNAALRDFLSGLSSDS